MLVDGGGRLRQLIHLAPRAENCASGLLFSAIFREVIALLLAHLRDLAPVKCVRRLIAIHESRLRRILAPKSRLQITLLTFGHSGGSLGLVIMLQTARFCHVTI